MGRLTKKGEQACAYPDCVNEVNEDDHCFGCGFFICEEHSNHDPCGTHEPVDHWLGDGEDD